MKREQNVGYGHVMAAFSSLLNSIFTPGDEMPKNDYEAVIEAPTQHPTTKGDTYVKPFDVVRTRSGREEIRRQAESCTHNCMDSVRGIEVKEPTKVV
ncbi:MAG: hypothetical protein JO053_07150 [Acidobacteria bacterium]|nr:hypothetical protein [Acidobacteriota bacterium]